MDKREEQRIEEVRRFSQLDFDRISEFQDIVDIAAQLCDKPIALITLLDKDSNWLKVRHGVDIEVMPRETSFCQYAIKQEELLIIPDATRDERFDQNPLVQSDPNLRFYAATPLILSNGMALGSLCLFDLKPNNINELQQKVLSLLGRQAIAFMELEMSRKDLERQIEEKEAKNDSLMKIAQLQSHQIRQPLTSIMGLVGLIREGYQDVDEDWLNLFEKATTNFDAVIHEIVAETMASKDLKAIRFNKMVEEIEDCAILLLDRDGNIENWNKGAEKIKGYNSGEIVGRHFSVFYTDHDKKSSRPQYLISEAEKNGVARDEGWRVRKNGEKFWGSIVITAIHDHHSNVIGFTKVTRDLTDITDIRESLKASADLYKHLVEQTNKVARVGGWELDLIKNELTWTSITRIIHGVTADYVPNLDTAINFYKEGYSRSKISELVNLAIIEGRPWDVELQLVTQQGKEIWVRATGNSNFKDGNCTKVYGTFQDIDSIKNAEINSDRSKRVFKDVLDAATELCIIATDLDGVITFFNSGAKKMFGYEPSEVIGKYHLSLSQSTAKVTLRTGNETRENGNALNGIGDYIEKTRGDGAAQTILTFKTKNGYESKVNLIITLLRGIDNSVTGYLGIATFITNTNSPSLPN